MFCSSDHAKEVEYTAKLKELELLEERLNKKAREQEAKTIMITGLLESKEAALDSVQKREKELEAQVE